MCVQGYESMRSSGKTSMGGKGRVRDTDGLHLQNVGKSYLEKWINTSSVPQHNCLAMLWKCMEIKQQQYFM